VVPPRQASDGTVRFGDRVVALDPEGIEHTYVIVGADEADPATGRISWVTPLGKAFLGAEEGDDVVVRRPRGDIVMAIETVDPAI
jgi:transcription elongation GreA/GreB family factor